MQHSPGFLRLVADAKTRIRQAGVRDVRERLNARENITLIDVREESEWARGHLPGAVHIGRGILERDIERAIPDKQAMIVLYCGGGYRSALAAESLQRMGYTDVTSMEGGWREWIEAGLPVEKP